MPDDVNEVIASRFEAIGLPGWAVEAAQNGAFDDSGSKYTLMRILNAVGGDEGRRLSWDVQEGLWPPWEDGPHEPEDDPEKLIRGHRRLKEDAIMETRDRSEDLPSGSALARVEKCKAALILPKQETTSSYAERGSVIHQFLEDCLRLGDRDAALALVPDEHVQLCELIDVARLPASQPGAYQQEMTFAWNPDSGEVASYRDDPRFKGRPDIRKEWILWRADVAAVSKDRAAVYVGDYKTGYRAVTPAARNLQVIGTAFAAARLYNAETAHVEIIYVRESDTFYSRAELDVFALEEVEERLLALVKEIRQWRAVLAKEKDRLPPQVMGEWCRYCPSFSYCPAQLRLINALGNHPMLLTAEIDRHLTPELATIAAEKLFAAERAIRAVHEAVYQYAEEHPITLADGQVLGPVVDEREYLDGQRTWEVLEQLHGIDIAKAGCELKSSKAAVRRAVTPLKDGNRRTIKSMEDEVLSELKSRGGINVKASRTIKVHNPK